MSAAAIARRMFEAGAPIEAILIALEAVEAAGSKDEARKAKDRERKRSKEIPRKIHGTSTEIPAEIPDPVPSPVPPYEIINSTPPTPPSDEKRATRGTRLPDGWQPTGSPFSPDIAARELAKFRDYWRAKAGKDAIKLDWDATWRNWCRNAADRMPTNGPGRQRSVQDAAFSNAERGISFGPIPPSPIQLMRQRDGEPPSGNPSRMLPEGRGREPGDIRGGGFGGLVDLPRIGRVPGD